MEADLYDLAIYVALYLGPGLVVVGLVLLFLMKVWPKMNGSPRAAGWMVGIGVGVCLAEFLLIVAVVSKIGS